MKEVNSEPANRCAGVWLDHRRAIVVKLIGEEARTERIESEVEKHTRLSGGSRSATIYRAQDTASESTHDRRFENQLAAYYARLIRALQDARELFIFGPGEAKRELKKALDKQKGVRVTVVAVESADKMTERQIIAKVRGRFLQT
jgi:hypothetical protein